MEEVKTQTQLYSEFLIAKVKRLDETLETKEKLVKILEYLGEFEGRKLYLAKSDQSEFYLQISNNTLRQTVKNFDVYGSVMQRRSGILLVKDLPAIYRKYQDEIDASLSKGKRF